VKERDRSISPKSGMGARQREEFSLSTTRLLLPDYERYPSKGMFSFYLSSVGLGSSSDEFRFDMSAARNL